MGGLGVRGPEPGLDPEQDPEVGSILPLDQASPDASLSPPSLPGLCAAEPIQATERDWQGRTGIGSGDFSLKPLGRKPVRIPCLAGLAPLGM